MGDKVVGNKTNGNRSMGCVSLGAFQVRKDPQVNEEEFSRNQQQREWHMIPEGQDHL